MTLSSQNSALPVPAESASRIGTELSTRLVCPRCKTKVERVETELRCQNGDCARTYPVIGGVPVLIHDENSLFRVDDFRSSGPSRFYDDELEKAGDKPSFLRKMARKFGNSLVYFPLKLDYLKGREALDSMVAAGAKRVLVVGSGTTDYVVPDDVELVYTDVAFGPQTRFVADCHDLPFADETFDGVLAIAIFEHVADPGRCASEIHRVLSPKGRIYAATPFMQPVHMGRYDFTRFTYLGHRRLMRGFDTLQDGMALGPGSTFGWALEYYLLSFSDNLNVRRFLRTAGLLLSVPFKITDRILQRKEGSLDAAGGLFFYGEKRDEPISDRELMTMYRGRDQVYEDMSKDVRSHF